MRECSGVTPEHVGFPLIEPELPLGEEDRARELAFSYDKSMRSFFYGLGVQRRQNMDNGTRDELLSRLAEAVGSVTIAHPTRVAVDGPPAAGKTTLADELAVVLRAQGREVIRASIEGFLLPRSQRYRRGEDSAEGCYHDSFDFERMSRSPWNFVTAVPV